MCPTSPKTLREGPAVPRLAQHFAARSHIRNAPFPILHRMMLIRKWDRKTRMVSPQVKKKKSFSRLFLPLGKAGICSVPHQHGFGLQGHICCSTSSRRDGKGGLSWPLHPCTRAREDICTPEFPSQRVQAPLSPSGAVGTSPAAAPHYCSEQQLPEWRGDGNRLC